MAGADPCWFVGGGGPQDLDGVLVLQLKSRYWWQLLHQESLWYSGGVNDVIVERLVTS